MEEFAAMGGYGVYVWASYGLAALVMIALALLSRTRQRRLDRQLAVLRAGRRQRHPQGLAAADEEPAA